MDKLVHKSAVESYSKTRRWRRYRVEVRVKVKLPNRGAVYGQGSDISEGGMALFLPTELESGQTIHAEVTLPYCKEKVMLRGVIRNRAGYRYGLEFSVLTDHEKLLIERVCHALSMVQ
jgi:c-di-GMP-binding flagellar brake protein YcgR